MAKADHIAAVLREQGAAQQETYAQQLQALEQLAARVASAFQQGGRLLLCGSGALAPIADLTAHHYLHRLSLERPSLPALSLANNPHLAAALARDGLARLYFARQLRALAIEGDIVLLLADHAPDPALQEALAAARQQGCLTVAVLPRKVEFSGPQPDQIFHLESSSPARLTELALTFCNLLCELVEAELFGL